MSLSSLSDSAGRTFEQSSSIERTSGSSKSSFET